MQNNAELVQVTVFSVGCISAHDVSKHFGLALQPKEKLPVDSTTWIGTKLCAVELFVLKLCCAVEVLPPLFLPSQRSPHGDLSLLQAIEEVATMVGA